MNGGIGILKVAQSLKDGIIGDKSSGMLKGAQSLRGGKISGLHGDISVGGSGMVEGVYVLIVDGGGGWGAIDRLTVGHSFGGVKGSSDGAIGVVWWWLEPRGVK